MSLLFAGLSPACNRASTLAKEERLDVVLAETLATRGALAQPRAQVLIDAPVAEGVKALRDHHVLQVVLEVETGGGGGGGGGPAQQA